MHLWNKSFMHQLLISPIKYQAITTTKEETVESQSRFCHMWKESVEPFFSESQEHTSILLVVVDNDDDGLPSAACDWGIGSAYRWRGGWLS